MLTVSVLTDARGAPSVNIEALASRQPMLADLLGSPRDKLECLTIARIAVVFDPAIFRDHFLVGLKQVATEALRLAADAEALILAHRGRLPCDIDATIPSFLGMLELPAEHLLGTRCHANLLN